jgi:predicted RecA/RadA family phage recombinase
VIPKLTLVRVDGASAGHPRVLPWDSPAWELPGLARGHQLLGVSMTDSETAEAVEVLRFGILRDCPQQNSETWAAGDVLWAKADGSATNVRPAAPLPRVVLGMVYEAGATFSVLVDVRVLPSLGELSGVAVETPADKDVFVYESASTLWRPRQLDHGSDLAGLDHDDHGQYLKEKASGGTAAEVPAHSHASNAEGGPINHRRWSSMMGD